MSLGTNGIIGLRRRACHTTISICPRCNPDGSPCANERATSTSTLLSTFPMAHLFKQRFYQNAPALNWCVQYLKKPRGPTGLPPGDETKLWICRRHPPHKKNKWKIVTRNGENTTGGSIFSISCNIFSSVLHVHRFDKWDIHIDRKPLITTPFQQMISHLIMFSYQGHNSTWFLE